MSIVMTGGGTGGHLAIVRAVKEPLKADPKAPPLVYIGSTHGQDRQWFEYDEDFAARYFLKTQGVVNQRGVARLRSLGMLFRAFLKARQLLKQHRARVVFSVGGFSAAPTALAAKSLGIPLVIHEQNAALGSLNKLLKPLADTFISSYEAQSPIRAYPIKQLFFEKARVRSRIETLLFLGGSQGAKAINDLALDLAPQLHARGIAIIHQAGERHIETIRSAYASLGIEAEVFGFTDRLSDYMAQADLAVARAGASTLWELSANGLPALFVPYPYAAGDHQYHNARFLVEKQLAWLERQDQLRPETVLALLGEDMRQRSRGLMAIVAPDGARRIAALLRTTAGVV